MSADIPRFWINYSPQKGQEPGELVIIGEKLEERVFSPLSGAQLSVREITDQNACRNYGFPDQTPFMIVANPPLRSDRRDKFYTPHIVTLEAPFPGRLGILGPDGTPVDPRTPVLIKELIELGFQINPKLSRLLGIDPQFATHA